LIPQQQVQTSHPPIDEIELIRKDDVLDPIDDDNMERPHNPYEGEALDDIRETAEELLTMITIKGLIMSTITVIMSTIKIVK